MQPKPFSHEWWRDIYHVTSAMTRRALRNVTPTNSAATIRMIRLDSYVWGRYLRSIGG